ALLAAIKRFVDQSPQKGQYFMTGSQNFSLLKTVEESMAGRVGIPNLNGLTYFEQINQLETHWLKPYLESPDTFHTDLTCTKEGIYSKIWCGQLPSIVEIGDGLITDHHASYIQTYLERDVRAFEEIYPNRLKMRELGRGGCHADHPEGSRLSA